MENKFSNAMKRMSDFELMEMINGNPDDYEKEALIAAKKELENRNLNEKEIDLVKNEIIVKQVKDEKKANQPLEPVNKVLAFIFPGIYSFIFSGLYKSEGYDKKASELTKFTVYGFVFYLSIICLIIILNDFF